MYFVTGASGFIGKHLIDALIKRGKTIHCLVFSRGVNDFKDLIEERWPEAKELFVIHGGDISQPLCGLSQSKVDELRKEVVHMFHLAALYDMTAGMEENKGLLYLLY